MEEGKTRMTERKDKKKKNKTKKNNLRKETKEE